MLPVLQGMIQAQQGLREGMWSLTLAPVCRKLLLQGAETLSLSSPGCKAAAGEANAAPGLETPEEQEMFW